MKQLQTEEDMNRTIKTAIMMVVLLALASCQESEEKAERAPAKAKLEAAQVKKAIESYIQINTNAEGALAVEDTVENRTRQLRFGYVHSSVHETEGSSYYACVDFTEAPADTLDLDFYVALNPDNEPAVSKVVIHKVNGKSRW
jgi:hypothetical protein